MSYNSMLRPSGATVTSGATVEAQTEINYSGSSLPETITATVTAAPDPNQVSTTMLDGLGRTSTAVGANGATVATTYDSMGRVHSVSNPYFTTQDSTYGVTTYTYDALGRTTQQLQSDGTSSLHWCYDGLSGSNCNPNASAANKSDAWVDATDENGNHSQRTYDAFGRITGVMEPNAVNQPALETDYTYDVLDDLSSVTQNGVSGETPVARSFSYDSMSRLIKATNAESGTTTYGYDANGNVTSKVDARGSATGGVWYCYDGLNRLTGKAYSQQNCPLTSPAVTYAYDVSPLGGQNAVGRLTSEEVTSGSTVLSQRQPYAYDPMGRLTAEQQCAFGGCSGTPYTLNYTYDAAGNMSTSTNGVTFSSAIFTPQETFAYGYDAGGRLDVITSTLNGGPGSPATLFSASSSAPSNLCGTSSTLPPYDGANQLQYAQVGNSAQNRPAVTTTRCYDDRLRPTKETDVGQHLSAPGVAASTTVTISGAEQLIAASGTAKQAMATLSFTSGVALVAGAKPLFNFQTIYFPGGWSTQLRYPSSDSAIARANIMATIFNSVFSPVTALLSPGGTASAASIVLTTKATGADQNGPITLDGPHTTPPVANFTGGAGTTYDTGTVTAILNGTSINDIGINGTTAITVPYGQSSTPESLASALAAAINRAGAGFTATAGTGGALTVTASQTGTADNGIPVTLSCETNEGSFFPSGSFSATSGTLGGGVSETTTPGTVYSYTIAGTAGASGYAANGNLLSYSDLMNGGWTLSYDTLNRVSTAAATSGVWNKLGLSWTYDSFSNRKTQTPSGAPTAPVPQAQTFSYPSQNRISNYGANGYDGAGNVLYDQINHYLYDPEGRLCAVEYFSGMTTEYMLYLYDGEGRRVVKVSNPTFSCTPASTGSTLLETYLLGPSGEHITELGQAGAFVRSNVYANGELLATYTNNNTYFALDDWLGSKRVVTKYDGTVAQTCMNLPFGDELMCSATDLSEQHFTGQIHDQETGNDYFKARYYSDNMGRFMSPDPSQLYYADPTNPQSLNLYSYGRNNPLSNVDPTGLDCVYINNDSGKYEGFNSGDCDNSTTARANSGYYVDGTVNQIGFNAQGQVNGYSASSGDGVFDSFSGSQNAGVATALLNPYTGAVSSPGQTVSVNGTSPASPSLNSASISSQIPIGYKPPPPGVGVIGPNPSRPSPNFAGDPSCFGAPDAVSAIHSPQRGVNQNPPSGSSDGEFGQSIYQRTTQGDRPFGNSAADTGFNAGFMIGDYGLSLVNCLQGH